VNGIARDNGGYTIAVRVREDNNYSVTICQCNSTQRYDPKLGEKVAAARMKRGQFFVQNKDTLVETLNTLHNKLCTGTTPRLNLDVLDEESVDEAA
jgi:hypothetical protein